MKFLKKIIGTAIVVAMLVNLQAVTFAQEIANENEIVEALAPAEVFKMENADHDPFRPVVQKQVKEFVKPVEIKEKKLVEVEQKKVVVPVKIKVSGICGNDKERIAVIEFEGGEYLVKTGQTVNGKFSVIEILDDRIVIYAVAQSRRDVFKLS